MLTCFVILYLTPTVLGLTNDLLRSHLYQVNESSGPTVSRHNPLKSIWRSGYGREERTCRNVLDGDSPLVTPRIVRLAVIAPSDPNHEQALPKILPSIYLAVRAVSHPETGILPGWDIQVRYRDSNCSSTVGPLAAVEFYINRSVGN
ncbi:hypothetical protein RUM43_007645 [Polyplax serrata]|uniref:Uncharacterized protein n=1 Tax=Polyplax serrata TaxID=468196 RepID=A0AAN8PN21_POLSC